METDTPRSLVVMPEQIPTELKQETQWLVWKWEWVEGRWKKPPYSPRTNRKASPTDPEQWCSFDEVITAYQQSGYPGIGRATVADDNIQPIDLDDCVNPDTGEIDERAWNIIRRLHSYTEYSPSGTGVRVFVHGKAPVGLDGREKKHDGWIEVYTDKHYFTVTGQHIPGAPTNIEDRQAELEAWYVETFPPKVKAQPKPHSAEPVEASDEEVLEMLRRSKYGPEFERLWQGEWSGYKSQSEADMRLMGMLAFATGGDEARMRSLFEASRLYRPEKGDGYLDRTIARAVANNTETYRKRDDRRRVVRHDWQDRTETPAERETLLRDVAEQAKERVRKHIREKGTRRLVVTSPPGTGKSHAVSELGTEFVVAWIAERHEQVASVKALQDDYRHIQPCSRANCPQSEIHYALARAGRNTWPLHKRHGCEFGKQYSNVVSSVFMPQHTRTAYVVKGDSIVVDELSIGNWIDEDVVTSEDVERALCVSWNLTEKKNWLIAEKLLRAVADAMKVDGLRSKALFDHLNSRVFGKLANIVRTLAEDGIASELRPTYLVKEDDEEALEKIQRLSPVVLPVVLAALKDELEKWERGAEWNSCIHTSGGALHILKPRQFPTEGELPPIALLDATADEELLRLLGWGDVEIVHEGVTPPPNMRHVAVRTGKRYSKTSLVDSWYAGKRLKTTIAEAKYLLRQLNPDGRLRVGLVTFARCEHEMRKALGIRRSGHFGAMRGSNELADCDVLLVIGTPVPNLEQLVWYARMLYRDDPEPIEEPTRDEKGRLRFSDERLVRLVEYFSHAELTQVAHRNRPLRYDGRVVVTMCVGEIADLPATELITEFPQLTDDGLRHDEWQAVMLESVYGELVREGVVPSVRKMRDRLRMREVRVQQKVLCAWLKSRCGVAAGLAA